MLRQITKNTYIGLGWDYANLQAAAPDDEFKAYMSKRHLPLRSTSSGLSVRFTYDSRDFCLTLAKAKPLILAILIIHRILVVITVLMQLKCSTTIIIH